MELAMIQDTIMPIGQVDPAYTDRGTFFGDGIYEAIANAGIKLPDRPRASDLGDALVNCFIKCEADPSGRLRGRRLVSLNDSDIHHTHHAKASVGAVAASAIGDSAVFCSVASLQQGPAGGGLVAAIVDMDQAAKLAV